MLIFVISTGVSSSTTGVSSSTTGVSSSTTTGVSSSTTGVSSSTTGVSSSTTGVSSSTTGVTSSTTGVASSTTGVASSIADEVASSPVHVTSLSAHVTSHVTSHVVASSATVVALLSKSDCISSALTGETAPSDITETIINPIANFANFVFNIIINMFLPLYFSRVLTLQITNYIFFSFIDLLSFSPSLLKDYTKDILSNLFQVVNVIYESINKYYGLKTPKKNLFQS